MTAEVFILVSGAWHGSWCWHKVVPLLRQAGHSVLTPDLPGYSLERWTQHLCDILKAQSKPAILVGHSRGGILISQVAERIPDRVKHLVYVSAFMLQNGESILRVLRKDGTSTLLQHVNLTADRSSWVVAEGRVEELFYGDCTQSDAAFACLRLTPEPAEPLMRPVQITERNFGKVPRTYIECLHDKALPLQLQRNMQQALPCLDVQTLATGHSPFFSTPDALAAHLIACAAHPVGSKY
jgi:pimeloyl-ACP methyl ester carboxylesterase